MKTTARTMGLALLAGTMTLGMSACTQVEGGASKATSAANSAARPWWAASLLAATMTPEVSLSSRCTIPGRSTPPTPESEPAQWCSRALTSVIGATTGSPGP